jgi:hypothetical protein
VKNGSTPKRMRRLALLTIAVAVLGALAYVAYERVRALAPARLRAEVEGLLARETRGPVEIGALQLVWGLPLELHGAGLRLYDGALTVEIARARIELISLLRGHPHLSRLELDGAELRFTQGKDGSWKPQLGKPGPPRPESEKSLELLRGIGGVARFLLNRPALADTVVVTDGRLSVKQSRRGTGALQLEGLTGELSHSRLLGKASLELQARWVEGTALRGDLTWTGSRTPNGRVSLQMNAKRLALSALAPQLRGLVTGLAMRGRLDGVAEFEGVAPGRDRFVLALTARDLDARVGEAEHAEWLEVERLAANARLALEPNRLALSDGRVEIGDWTASLDASMARPFGPEATTQGHIAIENLALDPEVARKLVGWLPDSVREPARDLVGRVREGRLVRAELEAEAPLEQWRAAFGGHVDAMLPALSLSAEVDGAQVALNEESRLESVSGGLAWSDGLLEVKGARALLDGQPLPVLDVQLRGLARLLASEAQDRSMRSTAVALPGITPLFEVFKSPPDKPSPPPPSVALDLDHLHHRALLWPMRRVRADVVPRESGLHVAIRSARWAGVPILGELEWTPRPERHFDVRLEAPEATPAAPLGLDAPVVAVDDDPAPLADDGAWAVGRIEIAPTQGSFRQRRTAARLRAEGARVRFTEVRSELEPSGEITGTLDLDLSREDAVPYALDAKLTSGDLAALLVQRGAQGEPMAGTLDLGGTLAGTLVPQRAQLHDASGAMKLSLRDGTIPKTVPPVLALALASDSLNPFSSRERIRYTRIGADLSFTTGTVSTQALEVEGPDLRLFAAGEIGLQDKPNPLRAELALFLFRQLDWALVKIPILNELLLGENKNLVAAYFKLMGTWQQPVAQPQPLLTMKDTVGGDILEGIPRVVIQGVNAIGGLLVPPDPTAQGAPAAAPEATAPPAGS